MRYVGGTGQSVGRESQGVRPCGARATIRIGRGIRYPAGKVRTQSAQCQQLSGSDVSITLTQTNTEMIDVSETDITRRLAKQTRAERCFSTQ